VKGRLNLFQASMLRWREMHPYTAVHVVRVEGPPDAPRLTAIVEGQLRALGLTGLVLDPRRRRFEYTGGPAQVTLAVHAGGGRSTDVLERTIERELNAPFARAGKLDPFRFFCIDNGEWFHLGLAYDHVIAGGDSIVVLLEGIVTRYCGGQPEAPPARPFDRYPATYRRLFFQHAGPALRGIRFLPGIAASCRRTVRPAYPGAASPGNGFAYRRVAAPELAALLDVARVWGVTVNDLLLAILLRSLEPLAGVRVPGAQRHELAVGSIVNLRRDFGSDPNATFGQFLSSFRISHPLPTGIALERVARDVHAETARIKDRKLYLQSLLGVALSGALWRFFSAEQRAGFYAKHYPTWGAITLVNVDPLWENAGGRMPPPEYLRAVSTGPTAPMVVAVTVAAGVLHAGISYQSAAFTAAGIQDLADAFVASCARPNP
jgi:hypothetical protein